MSKVLIFDIQKFSLVDGPGIRTTIFFKGCNLHCSWCHNPEGISNKIEYFYDNEKCKKCFSCVGKQTPELELEIDSLFKASQNIVCPNDAITIIGKYYELTELINIILKDKKYFEKTDGGVTLSGGEALLQNSHILEIAKLLKKEDISVALDLNGSNLLQDLVEVSDYVDIFLLDFKTNDLNTWSKYVGNPKCNFDNILKFLIDNEKRVWLRWPLIPNVNDDDNHFHFVEQLARKYDFEKIDILPYHNMTKKINKNRKIDIYFVVPNHEKEIYYLNKIKQIQSSNVFYNNKKVKF